MMDNNKFIKKIAILALSSVFFTCYVGSSSAGQSPTQGQKNAEEVAKTLQNLTHYEIDGSFLVAQCMENVKNECPYAFSPSYYKCIEQIGKGKTQAEIEDQCARENFELKMKNLKEEFTKVCLLYETRMQKCQDKQTRKSIQKELNSLKHLQQDFLAFMIRYGKSHASPFLRTYPYHSYGSMIDLLDIRLAHLKTLLIELE